MLFSLYDNKNAAKKNNAEKPNNATCWYCCGTNGAKPTVNETVAVLGVPNNGPIVAWINTINTKAKVGPSGKPTS